MYKVETWFMTEEERLAYIEKHPIKPTKKPKRSSNIEFIDYKWRSEKATESRWGKN
ncbi:hypothetical protein [Mesobacillus stamsii]|uniref:Uncharacterized protein n=1 Tax=Mesobacillus stamsii TaxID=225347 RepID=A0ABU0FS15_9BACI|nr:hypothetical protein [Mesobacillus stamsii]MDQ0412709.1 hypothetical protein [Mesobacillus stamsii]